MKDFRQATEPRPGKRTDANPHAVAEAFRDTLAKMVEDSRESLSNVPTSGTGWFAATIEQHLRVTYLDQRLSREEVTRLLDNLEVDIVTWPAERPRLVLYEVQSLDGIDSGRRRDIADVLSRHREKLAAVTRGFCLVTPSTIVRGLLTATFWLAPPDYPTYVTNSLAEGAKWLAKQLPSAEPEAWLGHYDELKRAYSERMGALAAEGRQA